MDLEADTHIDADVQVPMVTSTAAASSSSGAAASSSAAPAAAAPVDPTDPASGSLAEMSVEKENLVVPVEWKLAELYEKEEVNTDRLDLNILSRDLVAMSAVEFAPKGSKKGRQPPRFGPLGIKPSFLVDLTGRHHKGGH